MTHRLKTSVYILWLLMVTGCSGLTQPNTESKLGLLENSVPSLFALNAEQIEQLPAAIQAQNIAVLLPLSGPLTAPAKAIKEGILAAYFKDQLKNPTAPSLVFLDSKKITEPKLLAQIITAQNIDLIIGPLNKDYVTKLNNSKLINIPILALNYANNSSNNNIFQFGLDAENEAQQIANRIWIDGHRSLLSISSNSSWGKRVQSALKQRFTELGGHVNTELSLARNTNFSSIISHSLNTDKSQKRNAEINALSQKKIKTEGRRRQDIDAIFISNLNQEARQISPLLDFNYANNLPIYASSHIYAGNINKARDRDLNGIKFVTSPWLLKNSADKRTFAKKRKNFNTRLARFYALGIDTYQLYPYLNQLLNSPYWILGKTGNLSINNNKQITRQLHWYRFRSGTPKATN